MVMGERVAKGVYKGWMNAGLTITSPHGSVVERITSNDEVVSSILAVGIIPSFLYVCPCAGGH